MRFLLVFTLLLCGCGGQVREKPSSIEVLNASEFHNRLGSDAVVLDVRTPEEFRRGFIPGAINLDYKSEAFSDRLDSLDKSRTYLLYCASGVRSDKASDLMKTKGFTSISVLEGGIEAWEANGLPVQRN